LIHDAQYTQGEYQAKIGWGHSSYDQAVQYAAGANIKKLVFFHHEPAHTDSQLEQLEKEYTQTAPEGTLIMMAKEGLILQA
jgi:ribonuclease BN (tRNA processing enzyme)